ncbi:MAG: hypothetical protein ACOCY1_01335 [Halovenus sp.]
MPTVEKVRGNRVYIRATRETYSRGDRAEVDEDLAEYLTEERGDFEIVDADSDSDEETSTDSDDADAEEFDVDEWLDDDYEDRADAVRAGEVDEHLDEIDEAETSGTVRDAIGERRAELED